MLILLSRSTYVESPVNDQTSIHSRNIPQLSLCSIRVSNRFSTSKVERIVKKKYIQNLGYHGERADIYMASTHDQSLWGGHLKPELGHSCLLLTLSLKDLPILTDFG